MSTLDLRLDILDRRIGIRMGASTQKDRDLWMFLLLFSMGRIIEHGGRIRVLRGTAE